MCSYQIQTSSAKQHANDGSPRIVRHEELNALSIAHLDCDAFYASVEKRDNPALRDLPVDEVDVVYAQAPFGVGYLAATLRPRGGRR